MFEKKTQELIDKANFVQALGYIYDKVEKEMQWNAMEFHEADSEHEETWFTDPDLTEATDWTKAQYKAYKSVLDAIEKMAK